MQNKKEKVYAFIDSNNLYLAIKSPVMEIFIV